MASQTRTYQKKKLLGQVYTPFHIVDKIFLDSGFYDADLTSCKILDPACGDGRFLVPLAAYILKKASPETVVEKLQNLEGWDIDPDAIESCRKNLDELIKPFELKVKWNLHRRDALKQYYSGKRYDFIFGNPPYIRIQHLSEKQRKYIQNKYSFCSSGSTDTFIAFFQLAVTLLSQKGICGFITPNSYFTSETGKPLRSYFVESQQLIRITNYAAYPVFENASTYTAITIFGKAKQHEFRYEQCMDRDFYYQQRKIAYSELSGQNQWKLSVNVVQPEDGLKLGEICRISVGITTLADGFYFFTIIEELDGIVYAKSKNGIFTHLEKDLLKPAIKGSRLKTADEPVTEYVLFPYYKDDSDKQRIIAENRLAENFPYAYAYLLKVKPALDRRDNGKPNAVAWYAFGRAQALDTSFGRKIIFSPMNLYPNFVLYENPEVLVYSGYFIKYEGDYEFLLAQLNSKRMADFIAVAGRDFQGGYKGYNKKILENFIMTHS
ncbi:HsdM family class I SAM-dependent methyltransferase [Dyadobacter sediminis]|uniref:site-specific DNA-methyltransferase (adenine-specific) n=1 Tax=Dyadobacter sediminis TaxID=1493691 RepID=A0A5R9KJD2_9BACT|nr:N-6 DNA methylase [Dyadobacter sediminis]TLU96323.1 N-6 DNA methylase [Dyadobacter sediminis]GGB81264.1 DNA methyltransferase [Dyadobacter sediminis]